MPSIPLLEIMFFHLKADHVITWTLRPSTVSYSTSGFCIPILGGAFMFIPQLSEACVYAVSQALRSMCSVCQEKTWHSAKSSERVPETPKLQQEGCRSFCHSYCFVNTLGHLAQDHLLLLLLLNFALGATTTTTTLLILPSSSTSWWRRRGFRIYSSLA